MGQIFSSRRLAVLGEKAGNDKLGSGVHTTSVSQLSCPDGENNSYRCPLYNDGCYAEGGFLGMPQGTTTAVNKAAGLNRNEGSQSSQFTVQDAAEDEAEVISQIVGKQAKLSSDKWPLMRLHVVGDAVNNKAAQTISDAVGDYPAFIDNPNMTVQRVWGYTHAWRSVDRSSWGNHISMMASCDGPDDVSRAWSRGYAACIVVPCFKSNRVYDSGLGFKIVPCPNEAEEGTCAKKLGPKAKKVKLAPGEKKKKVEKTLCKDCRLCLRDDWLRKNKLVIAFAVHHGNQAKERETRDRLLPIFGS